LTRSRPRKQIIEEIARSVAQVMPASRVRVDSKYRGWNCVQISSYSKAWPCLFPQAGPGMKHTRKIELVAWQWTYVWQEPGMFLRGLLHSDGCRVTNKVWQVDYRNNRANSISVARRESVAKLDAIVGPKR
jgi:hypothetical protein